VHPFEACGILFGKLYENGAIVEKVKFTQNRLRSTIRFEVDPEKVAASIIEGENEGLELIGLFHSHPTSASPSSVDLKYMKLWGDTIWLIFSASVGNLAAYQFIDGKIKEATIRIK
jgi:proteasome lid subunit RPN8/RPN11